MSFAPSRINFAYVQAKDFGLKPGELAKCSFRSCGAGTLLDTLRRKSKPTVLDFGPLVRENVELLSSVHCKMFIEDFHNSPFEDLLESLPESELDAIILWDMLNYVTRQQGWDLVRRVTERAQPGAGLLMLTASGSTVPKLPYRFRMTDRENVNCEAQTAENVKCSPFTLRELEMILKGWKPVRSLHLRNGLQEHYLVFKP